MSDTRYNPTVAARVPEDLKRDLERVIELDGLDTQSEAIIPALRAWCDARLAHHGQGGLFDTAPTTEHPIANGNVRGAILTDVAAEVRKAAEDGGADCPACGQFAKVYRRRIHASMAHALIAAYKADRALPGALVDLTRLLPYRQSADAAKLRYWGLVNDHDGAGWSITDRGKAFVEGRIVVPTYAEVYNGDLLRLSGPLVGIRDALGKAFDYDELMSA